MFDDFLIRQNLLWLWDWRVTTVATLLFPFILTYLVTSFLSVVEAQQKGEDKTPWLVPYAVPFLGDALSFAFNTEGYVTKLVQKYGDHVPVRLRIANQTFNFINNASYLTTLLRQSRDLSTIPSTVHVIEYAFGSPATARSVYADDDTGLLPQPREGSRPLAPNNRMHYLTHKTFHTELSGRGLAELADHFVDNLVAELQGDATISEDWVEIPDLYAFVKSSIFKASTNALCGPHLLALNPDFVTDFWEFDKSITGLFKHVPRWMIPKAYAVRDRLHAAIMKWHKFANERLYWNDKSLADKQYEEFFGAKVMRSRQQYMKGTDGLTPDARAASDLGMIWATNANIVPLIGWCLFDILTRPPLLSRVLSSIASTSSTPTSLNMPALLSNPLLQSIYAEELRLTSSVFIQRFPLIDNFRIGPWKFPRNNMILASTYHMGRHADAWNDRGPAGEIHDVAEFWEERFLVYPDDPTSGPRRADPSKAGAAKKPPNSPSSSQPAFNAETVAGWFVPYGGGQKICPGRHYAKQEAMAAMALFLTTFDIELQPWLKAVPDKTYFGFGVMPPTGAFPARIRRRKQG